ncbi:hypothetical protein K437DRAFT_151000 [Tilletiaria anomala UBC 951]|uniref:HNH nuclease domain-containing protein n=1 Tax=Tilletiaria anomala (strain ATCC 24038 / CBS 436.72 / UBC 951) TaxID=1037660 RepID=A0A066WK14_TILAU|nr:uncharacterized protein K437DRAFT_151000 [Tilletiaria anomala UBC 951]KDN52898.1 hypothetical protein K437DRAFT_151000 [Tilletiaria anomala UBC 951]
MSRTTYPLALERWRASQPIFVTDEASQRLCAVPVDFLLRSSAPPCEFLSRIVEMCVAEEGSLFDRHGNSLLQSSQLSEGPLLWKRQDGSNQACTFKRGPRFKYARRAPVEGEDSSTMSNSKRSSQNQNAFRESLLVRDGSCLLTDRRYTTCTAAHILPQSRPEYYEEVMGYDPGYLFLPQYGFLVSDELHHAFDRGEWAFWPEGENLVVHFLYPQNESLRPLHGKVIPPERFRGEAAEHPRRDLLLFHYQQCVHKYFRGFSADLSGD